MEDYTGCAALSEILRILPVKRRRRGRTSMPGSPTTSSKSYRRSRCVYQGRKDPLAYVPHSTHPFTNSISVILNKMLYKRKLFDNPAQVEIMQKLLADRQLGACIIVEEAEASAILV